MIPWLLLLAGYPWKRPGTTRLVTRQSSFYVGDATALAFRGIAKHSPSPALLVSWLHWLHGWFPIGKLQVPETRESHVWITAWSCMDTWFLSWNRHFNLWQYTSILLTAKLQSSNVITCRVDAHYHPPIAQPPPPLPQHWPRCCKGVMSSSF